MPKATSQTFSTRPHAASARHPSSGPHKNGESSTNRPGGIGGGEGGGGGGGARNHLFNTERFGQHILTNPLVAQGQVMLTPFLTLTDDSQYRRQGQ